MSRATRSTPAARRFAIENLESRQLMAGDVDLLQTGGNLFITGDNDANGLFIRQLSEDRFAIIGTKTGSGNTTVEGQGFQVVNGVTGSVFLNMNGGNDSVKFDRGDTFIASRPGLPSLGEFPQVKQNLQVNMGAGADTFTTNGLQVQGRVIIDTGFGNDADTVKLDGLIVRAENGDQALEIDTQGGNDRVELIDGTFQGLVDIDTGTENDLVSIIDILISSDSDLRIRTQAGNDQVTIEDSLFDRTVDIETGAGQDVVLLEELRLNGELEVDMGTDNDILQIDEIIAASADLDGGLGTDALIDLDNSIFKAFDQDNFEIVV
ncbi:hypothetical protein NA78x_006095 [Anatilimnocola sp. NA78]|uniref:hypothetical protein n=1 Tax=Anatilimnocola sp. NA78 TaxID=3415683 RepID=UPI003CE5579C